MINEKDTDTLINFPDVFPEKIDGFMRFRSSSISVPNIMNRYQFPQKIPVSCFDRLIFLDTFGMWKFEATVYYHMKQHYLSPNGGCYG